MSDMGSSEDPEEVCLASGPDTIDANKHQNDNGSLDSWLSGKYRRIEARIVPATETQSVLRQCSIVVGLHPDGVSDDP